MPEENTERKSDMHEEQSLIDMIWSVPVLLVGYPIAAVMLLLSSPKGLWPALKGRPGRTLAYEWGESIIIAFILAMFIRTFLFQPFKIPSGSMIPTLQIGDRLFVNKLAYGPKVPLTKYRIKGFTRPKRGDVIVFKYPVTKKKDYIKRLVALGGETIEIKGGRLLVNGEPILDGTIANISYSNNGDLGSLGVKTKVPEGYYFVLGDNTDHSADSRYWGFVPEDLVIGRADLIFWPFNRAGTIK